MVALYAVCSPLVFAFRSNRLQQNLKTYYKKKYRAAVQQIWKSRSDSFTPELSFHGFGGDLDKSDVERLQTRHKLVLAHHSEGNINHMNNRLWSAIELIIVLIIIFIIIYVLLIRNLYLPLLQKD